MSVRSGRMGCALSLPGQRATERVPDGRASNPSGGGEAPSSPWWAGEAGRERAGRKCPRAVVRGGLLVGAGAGANESGGCVRGAVVHGGLLVAAGAGANESGGSVPRPVAPARG